MADPRDRREPEESTLLAKKREFLDEFFKKGARLTRELVLENERLKERLLELEAALAERGTAPAHLETSDEDFLRRVAEMEQENSDLASLFVAQGQLHANLEVREVVQVMIEILLNFVGAQRFAILIAGADGRLEVLATEGVDPDMVKPVEPGSGLIGRVAAGRELHVEADAPAHRREPGREDPTICFSLSLDDELVGVIAIWCFLSQKSAIEDLDRRIFDLLWSGGGRALEAARMASRVEASGPDIGGRRTGTFADYAELFDE
jgi:hypothetical protein